MKKKLIEVALPLEAINRESVRERSIRHGHPSTLHLWWSRKPLSACRAVLFASIVDDPSSHPDKFPTEEAQEAERQRLFRIIEELVKGENIDNKRVLKHAREEILKSTSGNPPTVYDPFCGGGSIPLEAQRLGLEALGSDLNPVAVLITKALIEIPPKFADKPPVNPEARAMIVHGEGWRGAQGLTEDVRYYGKWIRDEAGKRIGHLYPKVKLPKEYGGVETTVIAWIWARTVKCPNPACGAVMPLTSKFVLSSKSGKKAWIVPVIDKSCRPPAIMFDVKTGTGIPPSGTVNRRGAVCICCKTPVPFDYIRSEGKAGRMNSQLMALVSEGRNGRIYSSPNKEHESIAITASPKNVPDTSLPEQALGFRVQLYGMSKHKDLFTARQLVALTTFSDLVDEAREKVFDEAIKQKMSDDNKGLYDGGIGAKAYSEAIATNLAFILDKQADLGNALNRWEPVAQCPRNLFSRQTISMVWEFAEGNPLGESSGSWSVLVDNICRSLKSSLFDFNRPIAGYAFQDNAQTMTHMPNQNHYLISTDPPYYDNIGYADLSDFFYIWLRRSLNKVYPKLLSTVFTPKFEELVATQYRHDNDKNKARDYFEKGLEKSFQKIMSLNNSEYPLTIYYAFKQTEVDEDDGDEKNNTSSTGWETMLEGLLKTGFVVVGTWPIRTEMGSRTRGQGSNALASSIIFVCRPRSNEASLTTRRDFINALKKELPNALRKLQQGNIAPVDLAQAAIGPGMAVFSRYSKVIEADGSPMKVRTALALINQTLDEVLVEQEGEFDSDTRWAVAWFDQFGMNEGPYGVAETLSKAKNTSVDALAQDGFLTAKAGKVKLLGRDELQADWDPAKDKRLTVWEITHYLIRALERHGEQGAATLLSKVGDLGEIARDLAYRLYVICERKGWAQEGLVYNSLVISWSEITRLASHERPEEQLGLV